MHYSLGLHLFASAAHEPPLGMVHSVPVPAPFSLQVTVMSGLAMLSLNFMPSLQMYVTFLNRKGGKSL